MTTSIPRSSYRVTLEDVARAAGVSRATASRVISGYGASSTHAREKVSAAVAQLGYTPDAAARALSGGCGFRLVVRSPGRSPACSPTNMSTGS
jgi:DNA-binding LacI/PurR family transcriptional regulator